MLPRGIRNRNPGNIRLSRDKWQGLASRQNDRDFFQFISYEYGIRALARVLLTYQTKHGLDTVRKIINRWAPPVGNANGKTYTQDTSAYARAVAKAMGVKLDDAVDVRVPATMLALVKAIVMHENGMQPFADDVLLKGLALAGINQQEEQPHA